MTDRKKKGGEGRPSAPAIDNNVLTTKPPSRAEIARRIAPQCGGRHPSVIAKLLFDYGEDVAAVVRYCRHHPRRPTPHCRIVYDGKEYTRRGLARLLAPQARRSVRQVERLLIKNTDDVVTVLDACRASRPSPGIVFNGNTYASRAALARALRHRYPHAKFSTLCSWLRQFGLEQTIVRAKAHAVEYRARRARLPKLDHSVVVFGWRWRSFSAMRQYYALSNAPHLRADWDDHIAAGKSGALFPPLARKLARLWQVGDLDERNRLSAAREAKLPRSCQPLNSEPEEVSDLMERSLIDALQPPEVMTPRRACLRDLARMRAAVAAR